MENAVEISVQPLNLEDFDRIRCSRCEGYLNCPPLMAFLGRDDYAECGRCHDPKVADREGLHPIRNRSLELLTSVTPFPCKYAMNGCRERRTWPNIEVHEADCLLRPFSCPVSVMHSCKFEGRMQHFEEHFKSEHPGLYIGDGFISDGFDSDFENLYLVKQISKLFVLQVKNDVNMNKAWFTVSLLEQNDSANFNLEFTSDTSENIFIVKHSCAFKTVSKVNPQEAVEVDTNAIKVLFNNSKILKCKVFLHTKFAELPASQLLKEIQCPACWDYMKGRIYMCRNGHNICSKCKEFVTSCPVCRDGAILDVRNLSLEKVIACSLLPCKNHVSGCIYVATIDDVMFHYDRCSFTTPED